MPSVNTNSSLINVFVLTLAEFLSARLERRVVGSGLGRGSFHAIGLNNVTATFHFEGEKDNLCSLEYGQIDGWSKFGELKLVLSPYLKGINRSVYDELESIIKTDIGIGVPRVAMANIP